MTITTIQLKLDIKNHSKKAIPAVWPCKAWKLTRKSIAELHFPLTGDYANFDICGVYLLLSLDAVYVGEAEQVISRFKQHHNKPPFDWSSAIAFVSKEESFEKSHIKYLEHEIYQKLKKIGRYKTVNTSTPKRSHVSDEDTMRTYLDNIVHLADVLGFDGLIDSVSEDKTHSDNSVKTSEKIDSANKKGDIPETFFDYLKRTMCKNSASNYSSAFRALEKKLLECKVITEPLASDISIESLDAVRKYVSSNNEFLTYNKLHHYSRSAAWEKFEKYLEGIK